MTDERHHHTISMQKEVIDQEQEISGVKKIGRKKSGLFLNQLISYFRGIQLGPKMDIPVQTSSDEVIISMNDQERKLKNLIKRIKNSKFLEETEPPPLGFIETLSFENNDEDHIFEVVMEYLKEKANKNSQKRQLGFLKVPKLEVTGEEGEVTSNKSECFICLEMRPVFDFEEIDICGHKFCFNCMRDYLKECIYSPKILEIRCPNYECNRPILSEDEIEVIAPPLLFEKYKRLKLGKTVSLNPSLRWCIRPGNFY